MDDTTTWKMIHQERAATADTLASLNPTQWTQTSLCGSWTVREVAAHIVIGAEQTTGHFLGGMVKNGFRFNTMMDREARRVGTRDSAELIARLRARLTTTNHPPAAPVMTMLGEVVVHSDDIRRPLSIPSETDPQVLTACLEMYKTATFPFGTKKRIDGLRLVATDLDWSHGVGPEVTGPALSLVMAMTGRAAALDDLGGDGAATLRRRMHAGS
ncbi:MAG TPA: maleylpyruvate isomerase family mycothiol-dependent enzyme [Ilumatobacteraceae bacterium]